MTCHPNRFYQNFGRSYAFPVKSCILIIGSPSVPLSSGLNAYPFIYVATSPKRTVFDIYSSPHIFFLTALFFYSILTLKEAVSYRMVLHIQDSVGLHASFLINAIHHHRNHHFHLLRPGLRNHNGQRNQSMIVNQFFPFCRKF